MSEQSENNLDICPFNIGDLVKMRKSQLKLLKFQSMIPNDIGIVIDTKTIYRAGISGWLITVHWQQRQASKEFKYFHTRLKNATKKNKNAKDIK